MRSDFATALKKDAHRGYIEDMPVPSTLVVPVEYIVVQVNPYDVEKWRMTFPTLSDSLLVLSMVAAGKAKVKGRINLEHDVAPEPETEPDD